MRAQHRHQVFDVVADFQRVTRLVGVAVAEHVDRPGPEMLGVRGRSRSVAGEPGRSAVPFGSRGGRWHGRVLARSPFSLTLELELVPWEVIEQAAKGQVVVLTDNRDDRARAAVKLRSFVDAYLLVGRFIDPGVLENIQRTGEAVSQFRHLEERREEIFVTFGMIFVVVALLLLLAAVWIGLTLATQISSPVSELIAAAEEVRRGDLTVRVDPSRSVEEVGTLGRAFNRMTNQLQSQREGLMLANRDLDERRRFTETVLSGVSAGVIGLDGEGLINLPNRSASELLSTDLDSAIGLSLPAVVPEMMELLTGVMNRPERQGQSEIKIVRDGRPRTLIVRIAAELAGDPGNGLRRDVR